jgi:hypothetical protein
MEVTEQGFAGLCLQTHGAVAERLSMAWPPAEH